MVVQLLIVVRADIAAREDLFQVLHHRRIDRHQIFKVAVDRAVLHHQDLAVALDDLRLDLADLLIQKNLVGQLAVDDLLPNLRDAARAERIGSARPAKGRLLLLIALQQRLVRPTRRERCVGADVVQLFEHCPSGLCDQRDGLFCELQCLGHVSPE